MTFDDTVIENLNQAGNRWGVAVSGGSDSMALLYLAAEAARDAGATLLCASVDHGLRPEAKEECQLVQRQCRKLGLLHETLHWDWNGQGNLQAEARAGRYAALSAWARTQELDVILLGHTQDDVAETFLMRIARGSGLKGLNRMKSDWRRSGVRWMRPLLEHSRADLRALLRAEGAEWAEDPSNEDTTFDRVKARRALADAGVTAPRLAETAARLADADDALEYSAQRLAAQTLTLRGRNFVIDAKELDGAPDELVGRLLGPVFAWQGRTEFPPRREALMQAWETVMTGKDATLGGCMLIAHKGNVILAREFAATRGLSTVEQGWDGICGEDLKPGETLGALGENGLRQIRDWREFGLPRASLLAEVGIWRGESLIAVPSAGYGEMRVLSFERPPPFLAN